MAPELGTPLQNISVAERLRGATLVPTMLDTRGGGHVPLLMTADFPHSNGWSSGKLDLIGERRRKGAFVGKPLVAMGIGDGRELLTAGVHLDTEPGAPPVVGIDLDPWRAHAAEVNLRRAGVPQSRLDIRVGDGVAHFQAVKGPLSGEIFACIPQAPMTETQNHADGVAKLPSIAHVHDLPLGGQDVNTYGLSLNYGFLEALRHSVNGKAKDRPKSVKIQLTTSRRVPLDVVHEMVEATGWGIVRTEGQMVRHDDDTGIAYMAQFASELNPQRYEGMFEWDETAAEYVAVPPKIAEDRRARYSEGDKSAPLNLHHFVDEHILVPR